MTEGKLLEKIEEIVDKRVSQSEKKTQKQFEELELTMEHRFNGVDKELKIIKKQQDEDRKDWSEFFTEMGLFIEEMRKKIMTRIERIETHLDLTKN